MSDLTRPADLWKLILPEEGWKCLAIKTEGGMRHEWFTDLASMQSRALALDAGGCDVYHGCASFRERGSRKGDNALGVRSLWLDVDCGQGKQYSDVSVGWQALHRFQKSAGLPDCVLVGSGSGFHCYWPLERSLGRDEWERAARGLKQLCAGQGFAADPARTADIASILRPPGTRNHKYDPPRLVQGGTGSGTLGEREFLRLAAGEAPQRVSSVRNGTDPLTVAASVVHNHEPSYAAFIVDRCAQLAYLRDSKGNLPEPEWYAALGLLAWCEDGEKLAHEWSSGHPRYNPAETANKLSHARAATTGPTTCAGFEGRFAARCVACPQRGTISSPIQLGRSATPPLAIALEAPLVAPPFPYFWRNHKLCATATNADGVEKEITVYKAPIVVDGYRVGESGGARSLAIRHYHPVEGFKDALIKWDSIEPKTVINRLLAEGIQVYPNAHKAMVDFLMRSVDGIETKRATEIEYDQFGWKADFSAFLLGRQLYLPEADQPAIVGVGGEAAQRADMMRPRGTIEAWRSAANRLFAKGAEGQAFMLLCSFAAPLMKFRLDHGGVIVSAISHATGTGKTTALEAAASVWGELNAVNLNTNDTQNSRFRELAVLSNLPIVFDELREKDPSIIKSFVLSFTEGRDKNRVSREGKLQALTKGWSTIILSASNISLAETVTADNEIAQAARILEFEAEIPEGLKSADGTMMQKVLRANRGVAGREFLDNLVRPEAIAWCHAKLEEYDREMAVKLGGGTDIRFYSALMACVKAAGELLVEWGILEFDPARIVEFALTAATAMKKQIRESVLTPIDVLGLYINETWPDCLVMRDEHKAKVPPQVVSLPLRGKIHMRYEMATRHLLVERTHFRDWCRKNNQIFSVLEKRLAIQHIMLESSLYRQLGAGTAYRAEGQVRCMLINMQHHALGELRSFVADTVVVPAEVKVVHMNARGPKK